MTRKFLTKERRQLLVGNTIKLMVGILLLSFSFQYLNEHPAEKTSIVTGMREMFSRKPQLIFYRIMWRNDQLLQQKFVLENNYTDLLATISTTDCDLTQAEQTIKEQYEELKASDSDALYETIMTHQNTIHYGYEQIQNNCPYTNQ